MADNKIYLAIGEETTRGTAESTTVGFVPLISPSIPKSEFDDKPRGEFRGDDSALGETTILRMGQKWSASLECPFFTEAGGTLKAAIADIIYHFLGGKFTAQNGTTGQYYHMIYPVTDPYSASWLGAKALTLNFNINEGATQKNWPFVGGRVKALSFDQEPGQVLKMTAELFGQKRGAATTAVPTPIFPSEGLRCDYNNLKVYTGAITRTGVGPGFTSFALGSATQIKPDKISLKIENGAEDVLRISGLDYPDKTRLGRFKATLELTIDWEDPASGFSSVDEFTAWYTSASATNFFLHWDTGTQAGTGDTHQLFIDLPVMQRMGGEPDYNLDKDPMITLKYEALFDAATCKYLVGIIIKNTVATI